MVAIDAGEAILAQDAGELADRLRRREGWLSGLPLDPRHDGLAGGRVVVRERQNRIREGPAGPVEPRVVPPAGLARQLADPGDHAALDRLDVERRVRRLARQVQVDLAVA